MVRQWKEVVRLRFKGPRFEGHALDLTALGELSQFQRVVAETAKALWKAAHADAGRLPKRFEDRIRLCLRTVEEGSVVVPLEVALEDPDQAEMWSREAPQEVTEAVELAYEVYDAVSRDATLPERLPKGLVAEYAKWGQTLADEEEVEMQLPGRGRSKGKVARVNRVHRERLQAFAEVPYEDTVEVIGEVFEADVRQQRFQLRMESGETVAVAFAPEQEQLVTGALKEHSSVRVKVRGRAEMLADGRAQRFRQVEVLEIVGGLEEEFDASAPAIEDVLEEIAGRVPAEEWKRLPVDLTDRLDHYVYGAKG